MLKINSCTCTLYWLCSGCLLGSAGVADPFACLHELKLNLVKCCEHTTLKCKMGHLKGRAMLSIGNM